MVKQQKEQYQCFIDDEWNIILEELYPDLRQWARGMTRRYYVSGWEADDLIAAMVIRVLSKKPYELIDHPVDRQRLLTYCVTVMRRIMIDEWRRQSSRRSESLESLQQNKAFDVEGAPLALQAEQFLDLDQAFNKLEEQVPRAGAVATMRVYLGMSMLEVSEHLQISLTTANREWAFAKAFLARELITWTAP